MAYTTIDKPDDYFDTKLYTGNGSSQTLNMDNLGLLWMKNRTATASYRLFDSVRGGYYVSGSPNPILSTDNSNVPGGSDVTSAYGITFGSSSSTIGSDGGGYNYNQNGKSYVGWQWQAGTSFSNSAGANGATIASTGSVNTDSGFSIVKYTGTGSNGTIKHGLNTAPKTVWVKCLNVNYNWTTGWNTPGNNFETMLKLNSTAAKEDYAPYFNDTDPTSSVFSVGNASNTNVVNNLYIAYCFADVKGYSKINSYVGNGSATSGPVVYTGFKPAFVMQKNSVYTGDWNIYDNKRDPINVVDNFLKANSSAAAVTNNANNSMDFLSNGFKLRGVDNAGSNWDGNAYIYMAFAENPFVTSTGIPGLAR